MYSLFAKKKKKKKQLDQSWWVLHVYIQNVHKHIRNLLQHHFTKSGGFGLIKQIYSRLFLLRYLYQEWNMRGRIFVFRQCGIVSFSFYRITCLPGECLAIFRSLLFNIFL
jgi:hypothetical protein